MRNFIKIISLITALKAVLVFILEVTQKYNKTYLKKKTRTALRALFQDKNT